MLPIETRLNALTERIRKEFKERGLKVLQNKPMDRLAPWCVCGFGAIVEYEAFSSIAKLEKALRLEGIELSEREIGEFFMGWDRDYQEPLSVTEVVARNLRIELSKTYGIAA